MELEDEEQKEKNLIVEGKKLNENDCLFVDELEKKTNELFGEYERLVESINGNLDAVKLLSL